MVAAAAGDSGLGCHLPGSGAPGRSRNRSGRARAGAGAGAGRAAAVRAPAASTAASPRRAARRPRGRGRAGCSTLLRSPPLAPSFFLPPSRLPVSSVAARGGDGGFGTRSRGSHQLRARGFQVQPRPGKSEGACYSWGGVPSNPMPSLGAPYQPAEKGLRLEVRRRVGRPSRAHRPGALPKEDSPKSCRMCLYPPGIAPGTERTSIRALPGPPLQPLLTPALPGGRLGFWLARHPSPNPWWRERSWRLLQEGGLRAQTAPLPQSLTGLGTAQRGRKGLHSNKRALLLETEREGACLPCPEAPVGGQAWCGGTLHLSTHYLLAFLCGTSLPLLPAAKAGHTTAWLTRVPTGPCGTQGTRGFLD